MLLWPRWNYDIRTRYEVWPLIKVEDCVKYNKLYIWTKPWFSSWVAQIVASTLNAVLFWTLRNLSKSLIGNSELTCCDIFIFQIHMVTQLDSLKWVGVHCVEETTKQVSSLLELVWMFKLNFKNRTSHCSVRVWTECLNPEFQFRILHFGALYLPNQVKPVQDPLSKVAHRI